MPTYYHHKKDFKIIPVEEVVIMIKSTKDNRLKAILALVWITGARIGEILMLKQEDFAIDDINDEVRILFHTLKGGALREIKLSIDTPFIKQIILPYISGKWGSLFNIGVRRAEQLLLKVNEKTGYWYTFHEFRHSRITYLARTMRASMSELLDWTGWKSTKEISTYLIRESSDRFKDKIR